MLQLAQKEAQRDNIRVRVQEIAARGRILQEQFEACRVYARRPGLVVYEDFLGANPRRKVRVGDRVTASQVVVTIPEVSRMLVEASASEADVHRLAPGQPAAIRLEAFPDRRLTGKVIRIGTLARSDDRAADDKRFDVTIAVDGAVADLRPEMTARADVVTGQRADVVVAPVNAVFDRNGSPVAHVVTRLGTETRRLQLGEASDTDVEIVDGLAPGERVALIDHGDAAAAAADVRPSPATPRRAASGNRLAPR
jgi:hypothetical protein